ncbi:hypothetical protein [Tenacibaculum finnmarkense]|uniref:hypothetical protein n=1 Tax=Tenacibaculum finnmarkense TaxID=2781243 RepID=UPI001E4D2F1E|nr:hypothetical protein [Tenacibaculum finnmarkense]MCD8410396.1 hypothetical protein [Tenacibaculum finnmarkense genomovar ulcerans]
MSRKVETTHLQVKSVKNAKVLGTDKDGFVIESDLDFLNSIPKDGKDGIDIQAGTNITIDKTNPLKPIINASGGSSGGKDEKSGTVIGIVKYLICESKPYPLREGKPNDLTINNSKEEIKVHYSIVNGIICLHCDLKCGFTQTELMRFRVEISLIAPVPKYSSYIYGFTGVTRRSRSSFLQTGIPTDKNFSIYNELGSSFQSDFKIQFEMEVSSKSSIAGAELLHVYYTAKDERYLKH